jgi:hypothetical protein
LPDFPNNTQLKNLNRRDQGPKGLHIMILRSDGSTRHLTMSRSFLWIIALLTLIPFCSLAYLSHQYVTQSITEQTLLTRLENESRAAELRDYTQTVDMAPEEARRILEILDRAIVMSENGPLEEEEVGLVGIPDPAEDIVQPTEAPPSSGSNEGDMAGDVTADPPVEVTSAGSPETAQSTPLQQAWQAWYDRLTMPAQMASLDIDDFEVSSSGQVTFLLRQSGEPGHREKGRVMVVLAISDANDRITLVPAPEIDLTKPEQGWDVGAKYNIVASKLIRAKATIPNNSKILNAEVVAWEETSKELVYRKKIIIEDN